MAAAQGFTEVYNYSFVTEEMVRAFHMDPAGHVGVTNPIASDQTLLRATLLPAIRKNILDNSRHFQVFGSSKLAGKSTHEIATFPKKFRTSSRPCTRGKETAARRYSS